MTLGILVFPQVEELDFVGPWEMAGMWQQVAGGPQCLVVAERAAPALCAKGLSINPHVSFEDCPPLDYLLVPGGQGTRAEVSNAALLKPVQFASEYYPSSRRYGSYHDTHAAAPAYLKTLNEEPILPRQATPASC